MQKKCSKCGRPVNQVGKLIKITWLGSRKPLCTECRNEVKKKEKDKLRWKKLLSKIKGIREKRKRKI
ncbi:MAG: hypothetical protein QXY45_03695 [Candidatus Aenigmatarchaeota archaeon]